MMELHIFMVLCIERNWMSTICEIVVLFYHRKEFSLGPIHVVFLIVMFLWSYFVDLTCSDSGSEEA
jgi:hypothetical protein